MQPLNPRKLIKETLLNEKGTLVENLARLIIWAYYEGFKDGKNETDKLPRTRDPTKNP